MTTTSSFTGKEHFGLLIFLIYFTSMIVWYNVYHVWLLRYLHVFRVDNNYLANNIRKEMQLLHFVFSLFCGVRNLKNACFWKHQQQAGIEERIQCPLTITMVVVGMMVFGFTIMARSNALHYTYKNLQPETPVTPQAT
jgi:hypothetical protein